MFRKKFLCREDGQAMVEFALVIPIFLLILIAIIEFCWVSYQQMNFRYSYVHASWDLTEAAISAASDEVNHQPYQDSMEQLDVTTTYNKVVLNDLVKEVVKNNSFWGLDESWLKVSGTKAECVNTEKTFDVPGKFGKEQGSKITRTMTLTSNLTYHIQPLTFFGRTIIGENGIITTGEINNDRIVSTTQRTR